MLLVSYMEVDDYHGIIDTFIQVCKDGLTPTSPMVTFALDALAEVGTPAQFVEVFACLKRGNVEIPVAAREGLQKHLIAALERNHFKDAEIVLNALRTTAEITLDNSFHNDILQRQLATQGISVALDHLRLLRAKFAFKGDLTTYSNFFERTPAVDASSQFYFLGQILSMMKDDKVLPHQKLARRVIDLCVQFRGGSYAYQMLTKILREWKVKPKPTLFTPIIHYFAWHTSERDSMVLTQILV